MPNPTPNQRGEFLLDYKTAVTNAGHLRTFIITRAIYGYAVKQAGVQKGEKKQGRFKMKDRSLGGENKLKLTRLSGCLNCHRVLQRKASEVTQTQEYSQFQDG